MKFILRLLALLVVISFLYFVGGLIHGTFTDFQPPKVMPAEAIAHADIEIIEDSTFSLAIWNVGYGGLGKEMDFFMDAGHFYTSGVKTVRQSRKLVDRNIAGALGFLKNKELDFYLFQEVDINSKRSYYINQMEAYAEQKKDYAAFFTPNLDVQRIPIPMLEFWKVYGKAHSGLGTFSKYEPMEAKRLQLPGKFDWPTYIFQLDRCIGYFKYKLKNGKNLVVLNIHNSAYDKGGFIKKQQIEYFRKLVLSEYEQGNYVIAGGDWNQCPPDVLFDVFMPGESEGYSQSNIEKELLPEGWQWVADKNTPTNRKTDKKYVHGKSFVTLIDFFLVSPNIEVLKVEGIDQKFEFSDHQPVLMDVRLR